MDATQIAQLAAKELYTPFGDEERVVIAVAVALAESGGNEKSPGGRNTDGSTDTGLWQINSVHKRDHPTWTVEWLKNPENNAKAMSIISNKGTNWNPWVAYKNGKHTAFMSTARTAVDGIITDTSITDQVLDIPGVEGLTNAVETITEPIIKAGEWFGKPGNWVRIVQVAGGLTLAIVAAALFVKPAVTQAAKDVNPL